jgi:hypothetical protein
VPETVFVSVTTFFFAFTFGTVAATAVPYGRIRAAEATAAAGTALFCTGWVSLFS